MLCGAASVRPSRRSDVGGLVHALGEAREDQGMSKAELARRIGVEVDPDTGSLLDDRGNPVSRGSARRPSDDSQKK